MTDVVGDGKGVLQILYSDVLMKAEGFDQELKARVYYQIDYNRSESFKAVYFYIPRSQLSQGLLEFSAKHMRTWISEAETTALSTVNSSSWIKDLPVEKVFIYSELDVTINTIQKMRKEANDEDLSKFMIRSSQYYADKIDDINHGKAVMPPKYIVVDGVPVKAN